MPIELSCRGRIYGTEIIRGVDVFALMPSEYLTAHEIAAAELADQGSLFNPQQQYPVTWPADPVISLAYLDQLVRARPALSSTLAPLYERLAEARETLEKKRYDTALSTSLRDWAATPELSSAEALKESLHAVSRRLVTPPTQRISHASH